jgi:hypothetical protein
MSKYTEEQISWLPEDNDDDDRIGHCSICEEPIYFEELKNGTLSVPFDDPDNYGLHHLKCHPFYFEDSK